MNKIKIKLQPYSAMYKFINVISYIIARFENLQYSFKVAYSNPSLELSYRGYFQNTINFSYVAIASHVYLSLLC